MGRVAPLPPREWPREMMEALAPLSPENRRHPAPPAEKRTGGRDALATFAHHPALARAFFTFNGHILWDTTLSPRQRQILILRVAERRRSAVRCAPSSSETQWRRREFKAGATTCTSAAPVAAIASWSTSPSTVSFATTRTRLFARSFIG